MTKSLSDLLSVLADHAASFNEHALTHILRIGFLEAKTAGVPAPMPVLGIWDWDVPNNLSHLDQTCARLYGVEPGKTITPKVWLEAIHPADRQMVTERVAQATKVGGDYQSEHRLIVDGKPKWILSKGHVVLDKSGRPERFPGAIFELSTPSKDGY